MREGENTAQTPGKSTGLFRKILKENECAFFSLKSGKLYEGVDAKHTINFKRP